MNDKSVTSWHGLKLIVSRHLPNSLQPIVANKMAASLSMGKLQGNVSNGFWAFVCTSKRHDICRYGIQ